MGMACLIHLAEEISADTHRQYIAGFFLLGAFAHGAIYLTRDANLTPGAANNSLRARFVTTLLQIAHGQNVGSPLSCGDVLVHHAIALGLHTTVLVLLKAARNGSMTAVPWLVPRWAR